MDRAAALPTSINGEIARAHVQAVTKHSGTSFFWAMRMLPPARRDAMFAIYAFCREVDDIADGDAPPATKLEQLAAWRQEIDRLYAGHPQNLTTQALLDPVSSFELLRDDFLAVIDGMEMDAVEDLRAPDMATLELYCARVAGAVGCLSVRAFGDAGEVARRLALAEGRALQLTNILRDLEEDAGRGRLYLPRELLEKHGIRATDPAAVLAHPALPLVCDELAATARESFAETDRLLAGLDRARMRPAIIMMEVYRRTLDALVARGWRDLGRPVGPSKVHKLWIAFRHGALGAG